MSESQFQLTALTEIARRLTEVQWRILQALKDKGPGLLLEVAVRVMKFPEDVQEPLRQLQAAGLVTTQSVSGGQFGGELFSLTSPGERALRLMNDPVFQVTQSSQSSQPAAAMAPVPRSAADPRVQEAELLKKLGDVATEKGDLDKAIDYYQQALTVTRDLATGGETK
jgi:DNA-binding MarR family transcriptional regulator